MFSLGVFAFVLLLLRVSYGFDYCNVTCKDQYGNTVKHTMCLYPEGVPDGCSDFISGLNDEEKQLILDLHNQMRQKVANGEETRGRVIRGSWMDLAERRAGALADVLIPKETQPSSSSNMMELFWDPEAEMIAQRWANQCKLEHIQHDVCRPSETGVYLGQNIQWAGKLYKSRLDMIKEAVTDAWYKEVDLYSGPIDNYTFEKSYGHYTQLVWAETRGIGCGLADPTYDWQPEMGFGPRGTYRLVCNYSPSGNYPAVPMYKVGPPCSECPEGTSCSTRWPGLCSP